MGENLAEKIREHLQQNGGTVAKVSSQTEKWRIKFSDSTFTYYQGGTLYSTPSPSNDPSIFAVWEYIGSLRMSDYLQPTRNFLIGLDETGKGELVGHTVLTGTIFPRTLVSKIDMTLGPANTKKHHAFSYWDDLFKKLDQLRSSGFDFIIEKIPRWYVDRYNLNKIMDITYQRILSIFFRKADLRNCRIVLDDYGIGPTLKTFLTFLEKQGSEVIVTSNADIQYLEAKTASVVSKREREAVIKAINERADFRVDSLTIREGNAGNPKTLEWLREWHATGKDWPWFIKRSFRTIREIEGKAGEVKKSNPHIREEILSDEFFEEFNKGRLSIQSLSLVCPDCGGMVKSAGFAIFEKNSHVISELRCSNTICDASIENMGPTLRFYCRYVVPNTSVIQRSLISKDLQASRFFENFTIILDPVVRKECDGTQSGRKEFDELRRFSNIGRVKLEARGRVEDVTDNLSNVLKDERIIQSCLDYGAILLTADKSMSAFAVGKGIFTISI